MSHSRNTQLALSFFQRFNDNDVAGAVDLLADDATWWLAGKPDKLPGTGLLNKAQITEVEKLTQQGTPVPEAPEHGHEGHVHGPDCDH